MSVPFRQLRGVLAGSDRAKGASTRERVLAVFDPRCPGLNPAVS
jgi:hypothetical protein